MTREEYNIGVLQDLKSAICDNLINDPIEKEIKQALDMAIQTLEQEPNYKSFCEFVAKTIMEEDFELNAGAYAEIFCRKLADLGIVKADGDSWVLEREE